MTYGEFIEVYKQIKSNNSVELNFFDGILVPLISSLKYEMISPLASYQTGKMVVHHKSNKVVLLIGYDYKIIVQQDRKKQDFNNKTLIINFNLKDELIELVLPYFEKYVVAKKFSFFNEEKKFNALFRLIAYSDFQGKTEKAIERSFYQMQLSYDFEHEDDESLLFINEVNKLINSDEIISILTKNICSKLNYSEKLSEKVYQHISNVVHSSANHYKLKSSYSLSEEEQTETDNHSDFTEDPLNAFKRQAEINKQLGDDDVATIFKQR